MHSRFSAGEWVAAGWALVWLAATVWLHFRLVERLRAGGRDLSWWKQNHITAELDYIDLCRGEGHSPWPTLRPIVLCFVLALPAFVYLATQ